MSNNNHHSTQDPVFITELIGDDFLKTTVKRGARIGLPEAKENTESVLRLSGGKNYPLLVDLREINSISKEARDHFSMRGRKPHVTAIGMLVSNPVSVVVGNFFLGLNKPSVPTRMFMSEKNATQWLKEQNH